MQILILLLFTSGSTFSAWCLIFYVDIHSAKNKNISVLDVTPQMLVTLTQTFPLSKI